MQFFNFKLAVILAAAILIPACGGGGGGGSFSPTTQTTTGGGGGDGGGEGNNGPAVVAVISGESENGGLRRISVENINSIVPVTPVNLGEVVVDGGPTPSGDIGIRVDIGRPAPEPITVRVSLALNVNADNFENVGRGEAVCDGLTCIITIPRGERDIHVLLRPRNGNTPADPAAVISPDDETASEEADRLAREEEAELLAREEAEEAERLAAEEAERIEAERQAAEEEARRVAEEARLAAEEAARQAANEAERLAAEAEAQRLAAEEAARLAAEEAKRIAREEAEAAALLAREEAERNAADEAARNAHLSFGERLRIADDNLQVLADEFYRVGRRWRIAQRMGNDVEAVRLGVQWAELDRQLDVDDEAFIDLEEEARRFFAEPDRIPDATITPILKRVYFVDGSSQTILPEQVAADRDARFRKGEDGNGYKIGLVRGGEYEGEYEIYSVAISISEAENPVPPAPLADGESFFRQQLEFAALGVWVTGDVADANFRYGSLAENVVTPPPSVEDTSSIPAGDRRQATYYLEGDFTYRGAHFYPDGHLYANFDTGKSNLKLSAHGDDLIDDFGGGLIPDANDADYDRDRTELRQVHAYKHPIRFPGAPERDTFSISIQGLQINAEGIVADENTNFHSYGYGFFSSFNLDSRLGENDRIGAPLYPYPPDNPLHVTGKFHDDPGYNGLPREVSGDLSIVDNDDNELRGGFLGKRP